MLPKTNLTNIQSKTDFAAMQQIELEKRRNQYASAAEARRDGRINLTTCNIENKASNDRSSNSLHIPPVVKTIQDHETAQIFEISPKHAGTIDALTQLSDGRLASGSSDRSIKLWDVKAGYCSGALKWNDAGIKQLVCLGDNRLLAGSIRTITAWNTISSNQILNLKTHETASMASLVNLENGFIASCSSDQTIKLWDIEAGTCVSTLGGQNPVLSLTKIDDGRLASVQANTIKLWDTTTGTCCATLSQSGIGVTKVIKLSNGQLVSVSGKKGLEVWDLNNNSHLMTWSVSIRLGNDSCFTSLSNQRLAASSYNQIEILDEKTHSSLDSLDNQKSQITSLTALQDGRLVSGAMNNIKILKI